MLVVLLSQEPNLQQRRMHRLHSYWLLSDKIQTPTILDDWWFLTAIPQSTMHNAQSAKRKARTYTVHMKQKQKKKKRFVVRFLRSIS